MKDYFSTHSKVYATFRPLYPENLYTFIFNHVKQKNIAWDCATGNGQVAQCLSKHFKEVHATDISKQQIENAYQANNINYSVGAAEKTSFPDKHFDLITVGQALHWFDKNNFYSEVKRVAKPDAVIAAWCYALLSVNPVVDSHLIHFYKNIVGPYWDEARKLIDDEYRSIEFPFEEIPTPSFSIEVEWNLHHLSGYLESWSATQKYIKVNKANPVDDLVVVLREYWSSTEIKKVTFPLFLRLGKIK